MLCAQEVVQGHPRRRRQRGRRQIHPVHPPQMFRGCAQVEAGETGGDGTVASLQGCLAPVAAANFGDHRRSSRSRRRGADEEGDRERVKRRAPHLEAHNGG